MYLLKYYAPKVIPLVIFLNIVLMTTLLELEQFASNDKQTRSDFFMEGSQNIDLKDFRLLINHDICDEDDIKIVTIVSTALENKAGKGRPVYDTL